MPVMGSIEMVKQIKQISNYKFTPICMLTTEFEPAKMAERKASGAKAEAVIKPFQPPMLLDAVSKLILP
jgi:two-component system chemotaxis response regulator CheY